MPDVGTTAIDAVPRSNAGACLLCGGVDGPVRMSEGEYVGRACACGTIYIDPVPSPTAVQETEDFHLDSYYSLPASMRLGWATRFATSGRFLEVGCGSGELIARALAHGFECEAVEPNAACADFVRTRYGITVEESLIEDSCLPDERFDLIYHVDLLSHFTDPIQALEAMATRLRPGGVMCFEVGLFAGLPPRWYSWVGRPRFPAHRLFYSEASLERVLERGGFELVAIKKFAIAPATVVSAALRRVLPENLEAVPSEAAGEADVMPPRGGLVHRAYARTQHILRYRVGAVVPVPGPQTAFVAARRIEEPRP